MLMFPEKFFWGCSTSSHQIEGNTQNDWSEWERSPARLAELQAKGLATESYLSGKACNSFSKPANDIQCLKQLGTNAYRFSLEWSRLEPERGRFNEEAFVYYESLLHELRKEKIEPFVTLWHWPVPVWVRDQGGWLASRTAEDFARFCRQVCARLGPQIRFWITLNEPLVYASNSYYKGEWPPQIKSLRATIRVLRHLVAGHKLAYMEIKKQHSTAQIGIASHNIHFSSTQPLLVNRLFARAASAFWNHWFLKRTQDELDFIGLNYYFLKSFDLPLRQKEHLVSDIGWELRPEGVEKVLLELRSFDKPVYITEHGLADHDDKHRGWYITESLRFAHRALQAGVDLRGYFHWSLMDNFEWAQGFAPKFGLFETDPVTCERRPRPSVQTYKRIIEQNGVLDWDESGDDTC